VINDYKFKNLSCLNFLPRRADRKDSARNFPDFSLKSDDFSRPFKVLNIVSKTIFKGGSKNVVDETI